MKKIILVLLILLTASFADYVIKKNGTLTKVVDQPTVPETPSLAVWEELSFPQPHASSVTFLQGGATAKDSNGYIKLTAGTKSIFGSIRLPVLGNSADLSNYEIRFVAYTDKLNSRGDPRGVRLRFFNSYGDGVATLTTSPKEYRFKVTHTRDSIPQLVVLNVPKNGIVYIKNIKVFKRKPVTYIQPPNWPIKGATTTADQPTDKAAMRAVLDEVQAAGANTVFLIIKPSILQRPTGQGGKGFTKQQVLNYTETYVKTFFLEECKSRGLQLNLSIENMPTDDTACKDKLRKGYWTNPTCMQDFKDTVRFIANTFKDIPVEDFLGYSFMGEAVDYTNHLPKNWREVAEENLKIMRQYDQNKFLYWAGGYSWGNTKDYPKLVPLDDNRVIYSTSFFAPQYYTHQGIKGRRMPVSYPGNAGIVTATNNMRVFMKNNPGIPMMAVFSAAHWAPDREKWYEGTIKELDANNISWFAFGIGNNFKGWDPRYTGKMGHPVKNLSNPTWQVVSRSWKRAKH